jgi:hypothetical protein
MFKNMSTEYEYVNNEEEYDSESEYEYDDPYYIEPSNEYLDNMSENYSGKYIGEKRTTFPNCKVENKKQLYLPLYLNIKGKLFFIKDFNNTSVLEKENKEENKEENCKKEKKCWQQQLQYKEDKMSTNLIEFPELGISSKEVEIIIKDLKDDKWVKPKEKIKKTSPSTKSYISDISDKSDNTSRSDGYFTKLCSFFLNNKNCPHQDRCTYAHKTEDLIIKDCRFDDICKNVKQNNNIYINSNKDNICVYIHSNETKNNYLRRVYNFKENEKNEKKEKNIQINENIKNDNEIRPLLKWCEKPNINVNTQNNEIKPISEKFQNTIVNIDSEDKSWICVENKDKDKDKDNSRTKAFDILSDKEKIKKELKFTKMCFSYINNIVCPHKDRCRFAHDVKELVIRDCLFQDKCFNIKKELKDGVNVFVNVSKTKICDCIHKNESIENYYIRIGIKSKNDLIRQKSPPIFIKKVDMSIPKKNPWDIENIRNLNIKFHKIDQDIVKPDIVKPDIVKPDIVKPDIVKPDVVKPDVVKPHVVKPDIVKPHVVKPDIVKPDIVKPDIVKPDIVKTITPKENPWFKNKIITDVKKDIYIKVPKNMEKIVINMANKNGKSIIVETY